MKIGTQVKYSPDKLKNKYYKQVSIDFTQQELLQSRGVVVSVESEDTVKVRWYGKWDSCEYESPKNLIAIA
tara:strand:- start:1970 stop:2182 length:213 start_codon:yes stop_codon:yes gene_type:complete